MIESLIMTAFNNAATTFVGGIFLAGFSYIALEIKRIRAGHKVLALLVRDRIIRCHYAVKKRGTCSVYERDTIMDFYNEFSLLVKSDAVIEGLIKEIEELPVIEDK